MSRYDILRICYLKRPLSSIIATNLPYTILYWEKISRKKVTEHS